MTTEEKLMALKALTPTRLEMRKPGDWYVLASYRDLEEGGMLRGAYGNGETPQAAIDDDWAQISAAPIVVTKDRRVRWNGYMWEDVK